MYDILFVKVLLLLLSVPTRVDQSLIFCRCLKLSLRISGDSLGTLHVTVCDTGRLSFGYLRAPITVAPFTECLIVELTLPVCELGLSPQGL